MRSLPHQVSVIFLVLLSTLSGCVLPPLQEAASSGNTRQVRALLDHGGTPDQINAALPFAACNGRTEVVQLLLERGANVNFYIDNLYVTGSALQCATALGNEQMVFLLLRYGADPEFKGRSSVTPLELAKQKGNASIVKMLESAPTRPSRTGTPPAASPPPPPIY